MSEKLITALIFTRAICSAEIVFAIRGGFSSMRDSVLFGGIRILMA